MAEELAKGQMKKISKLINMDINEISFVDKAANQKTFIFKRDDQAAIEAEEIKKAAEAKNVETVKAMLEAVQVKEHAIWTAKRILETGNLTAEQAATASKLLEAAMAITF